MIQLRRTRTKAAIPSGLRGPARLQKLRLLVDGRRADALEFKSQFWKPAKEQLKQETGGKCAYCEASTSVVAHGDVEHFRPKSKYWWLAYCYDNYLFACQICNQLFKGDNFPVDGQALAEPDLPPEDADDVEAGTLIARFTPDPLSDDEGMPIEEFFQALREERAVLPDPYLIDPEPLFRWVADPVLKEVAIAARDESSESARTLAAVEQFYGLNRQELKRVRWPVYRDLEMFKRVLEMEAVEEDLRREVSLTIRQMMAGEAQFAGMVRYFVRDEWRLNLTLDG